MERHRGHRETCHQPQREGGNHWQRAYRPAPDLGAEVIPAVQPAPEGRVTLHHCRWAAEGLRSEEHTSELQSPCNLVCRLLLEKKKKDNTAARIDCSDHAWPK